MEHGIPREGEMLNTPSEFARPTVEEQISMRKLQNEIREIEIQLSKELSRKEKNHLKRKIALLQARLKALENGDFGRRIPDNISSAVIERDKKRDFGRPGHLCDGVRPPHHITHFETFKGSHTRDNPHKEKNWKSRAKIVINWRIP